MNSGITEDHKGRWLLTRLALETLLKQLDISNYSLDMPEEPPPTISRGLL